MKDCIGCELRQARFLATSQLDMGWTPERVCSFLSNRFGERYYVEQDKILRKKKLGDFIPYIIVDLPK